MAQDYILLQKIQEGIQSLINQERQNRGRDNYYIYGVIAVDNNNGTYDVTVGKDTWTLKPRIGKTFTVGNVVMILVPNGDKNNMFIDDIRPW